MKRCLPFLLLVLSAAPVRAEEQPSAAQLLLNNLNRMRAGLEQEEAKESENLRNALGQGANWRDPGTTTADVRARMSDNMRNIREPFRCLDVDIEKNSGPVVLVCGNSNGNTAALQQNRTNSGNTIVTTLSALQP